MTYGYKYRLNDSDSSFLKDSWKKFAEENMGDWTQCQRDMGNMTLFFGKHSPLSNFYECTLVDQRNTTYNCTEQYYQSEKARFFCDDRVYRQIMATDNPTTMKRLSRTIKGFDNGAWSRVKDDILYQGCTLKFQQNAHLAEHLKNTRDVIVEASPYDKHFGIGLAVNDPRAWNKATWKGSNVMGEILMDIKRKL